VYDHGLFWQGPVGRYQLMPGGIQVNTHTPNLYQTNAENMIGLWIQARGFKIQGHDFEIAATRSA
jgi:hypothetical protein